MGQMAWVENNERIMDKDKIAELERKAAAFDAIKEYYLRIKPDGIVSSSEGVRVIYALGEFSEDQCLRFDHKEASNA